MLARHGWSCLPADPPGRVLSSSQRAAAVKQPSLPVLQSHTDQAQSEDILEQTQSPAEQASARSPAKPAKQRPSISGISGYLQQYGTANNRGVLLRSMRHLHDVLLTAIPNTSSLPAHGQHSSWPLPLHLQLEELLKDDRTSDRAEAFVAISLLAQGLYALVPTMGPLHLARLYSLIVNASHRGIIRMWDLMAAQHRSATTLSSISTSTSTMSAAAADGQGDSSANNNTVFGKVLHQGYTAIAALLPRMHQHALSLMRAGRLAGAPLRTVLVGMAELKASCEPHNMVHVVNALVEDVNEKRLHPGGHARAVAAAARLRGIGALPPQLLQSVFQALFQPLAELQSKKSEGERQRLGITPKAITDLIWLAGQMNQLLGQPLAGQRQVQGPEQQLDHVQPDPNVSQARLQWHTGGSTYVGQLYSTCGLQLPRHQQPSITSSAGLQHPQPSSEPAVASWAAARHAWTQLTPFLVAARLESVLLSLSSADLAHLLASWQWAGLPTRTRTLRRLLVTSDRFLKPDTPPLQGPVLAQMSCAAVIAPSEQHTTLPQQSSSPSGEHSQSAKDEQLPGSQPHESHSSKPAGPGALKEQEELWSTWLHDYCRKAEEGLGRMSTAHLRVVIANLSVLQLRLGTESSLRLFPATLSQSHPSASSSVLQQLADPTATLSPATLCHILKALRQPASQALKQPLCSLLLQALVLRCMITETVITANLAAHSGQLLMYAQLMADAPVTGAVQAACAVSFAEPHRFSVRPIAGEPTPEAAELMQRQLPVRAEQLLGYLGTLISEGVEPGSVLTGAAAVAVVRLANKGPQVLSPPKLCWALLALAHAGFVSKSKLWRGSILGVAQSYLSTGSLWDADWAEFQRLLPTQHLQPRQEPQQLGTTTGDVVHSSSGSTPMRPILTLLTALVAVRIVSGVAFEAAFYSALQSRHLLLHTASPYPPTSSAPVTERQCPPEPHELAELLELMVEVGLPGNTQLLSSIQAALCRLMDEQHPGMSAELAVRQVQALLNLATVPTPQLFSKVCTLVLEAATGGKAHGRQDRPVLLQRLSSVTKALAVNAVLRPKFGAARLAQEASSPRELLLQLNTILTSCINTSTAEDQETVVLSAQQLLGQIAGMGESWQVQHSSSGDSKTDSHLSPKPARSTKKSGQGQPDEQQQDSFDAFIDQQLGVLKQRQADAN